MNVLNNKFRAKNNTKFSNCSHLSKKIFCSNSVCYTMRIALKFKKKFFVFFFRWKMSSVDVTPPRAPSKINPDQNTPILTNFQNFELIFFLHTFKSMYNLKIKKKKINLRYQRQKKLLKLNVFLVPSGWRNPLTQRMHLIHWKWKSVISTLIKFSRHFSIPLTRATMARVGRKTYL